MADPVSGITGGFDIPVGGEITDQMLAYMQVLGNFRLQAAQMQLGYDVSMQQIGAGLQQATMQLQGQLAGVAQAQRAADQQYDIDLRQLGLQAADLNYRQRVSQVQAQLATIDSGINHMRAQTETAMANWQQRSDVAGKKMQIAQMLADRSGPRDLVAYNSLLNYLDPEAPGGGQTDVDPFSWLDDLYQPIEFQLPEWAQGVTPDPNSINQPYSAGSAQGAPVSAGYTGGGAASAPPPLPGTPGARPSALDWLDSIFDDAPADPTAGGQYGPDAAKGGEVGFPIANVPGGGKWSLITMGPGGDVARGDFDPSISQVYAGTDYGPNGLTPGAQQVSTAKAGQNYWVYRMAKGGKAEAREVSQGEDGVYRIGPVMVGDNVDGMPSGNEEVAMVKTTDPNAELTVDPVNPRGMAAQASQEGTGSLQGADPMSIVAAAVQEAISALSAAMQGLQQLGGPPPDEGMGMEAVMNGEPEGGMPMPMAAVGGEFHYDEPGSLGPRGDGGEMRTMSPVNLSGGMAGVRRNGWPAPPGGGGGAPGGGMEQWQAMIAPFRQRLQQWMQSRFSGHQMPQRQGWNTRVPAGMLQPRTAPQANGPRTNIGLPGLAPGAFEGLGKPGDPYAGAPGTLTPPPSAAYPPAIGGFNDLPAGMRMPPTQDSRISIDPAILTRGPFTNLAAGGKAYPRAASGGSFDPSASADESFGGGNTSPIISIRRYTPEQIAALPAVQKTIGGMTNTPAFGKPAVPFSNPAVGLENVMPWMNLQRYAGLDDTERDLVYSLRQQGLEQDMRDVLRRSMLSAPGVVNWQQGMSRVA